MVAVGRVSYKILIFEPDYKSFINEKASPLWELGESPTSDPLRRREIAPGQMRHIWKQEHWDFGDCGKTWD